MSETPEQAYISKVHLKGYKSIRDLEIDFKPGLNIIIGPNGSGKTNFLEFLKEFLFGMGEFPNLRGKDFMYFLEANIEEGIFQEKVVGNIDYDNEDTFFTIHETIKLNYKILEDSEKIYKNRNTLVSYKDNSKLSDEERVNRFSFIYDYEIIEHFNILNQILDKKSSLEFSQLKGKLFMKHPNGFEYIPFYSHFSLNRQEGEYDITNMVKISEELIINLNKHTPIRNLRIDGRYLRQYENEENQTVLDGIVLQFFVNNKWLFWNQLSDGTKRLFYIFTSILFSHRMFIFLEEPELGIHPDQLHKLMDFLIEQSKEKQIIITTHSPEVLNAIHPDELDRIIVTRYDAEKGTIMRKLSPEQAKEMGERIKQGDMFLSDRWVHLNLEDEIFNAGQLDEK